MKDNIPWEIIYKSIQNQANQEELARLQDWLEADLENREILAEIFSAYSQFKAVPPPFEPDHVKAWELVSRRISGKKQDLKRRFGDFKYAAASVALLLVGLGFFWFSNLTDKQAVHQYTSIIAPSGHKSLVILPDNTSVWLNSGSTLKYSGNFNINKREVILEGEAYFDVQEDRSKMFCVSSGIFNIQVYGTSFNVKNYANDSLQEITVAEGKVGISSSDKELRQLGPGEQAVFNKKSKRIAFTKTDPQIISSWKSDELIFDNTPFEEVAKYLERWYGVQIAIDSSMMKKHNYTFMVKTESFREMLEMLKVMTPLTYEINGNKATIRYLN
jgi:transmembrane sensor